MKLRLKLKRASEMRRLTNQRELARLAGVTKSSLGRWLSGGSLPELKDALKLAKVLEVPLDWLADEENDDEYPPVTISEDEAAVLRLFRALQISGDEALRRLSSPSGCPTRQREEPAADQPAVEEVVTPSRRIAGVRIRSTGKKPSEGPHRDHKGADAKDPPGRVK